MVKRYGEGGIQTTKHETDVDTPAEVTEEVSGIETLQAKEYPPTAKADSNNKNEQDGAVDASIESLRQKIEQLGIVEHPFFQELTQHTPEELLGSERTNKDMYEWRRSLQAILKESELKPEIRRQFLDIFVHEKRDALEQKTRAQLRAMRSLYFAEDTVLKHPLRYMEKRKKLNAFRQFISSLSVFRVDDNVVLTEFKSPRTTRAANSFGAVDIVVQADNYVYGSVDHMTHHMARYEPSKARLDTNDVRKRGEIVVVDAADMMCRTTNDFLEQYIKNTFDFIQGSEIIALHLASTFHDVAEAEAFYVGGGNGGRAAVQRWDTPHLGLHAYTISKERMDEIIDSFKYIFTQTGIEPPLGIEIRIPHSAIKGE